MELLEHAGFVNALAGESVSMDSSNLVVSDLQQTSGYSPYALDFDGISQYIDFGNSSDFNFGSASGDLPFSISGWVKPDVTTKFRFLRKAVGNVAEYLISTNVSGSLLFLHIR